MIDLNLKPKPEKEESVGEVIAYILPVLIVLFVAFMRAL